MKTIVDRLRQHLKTHPHSIDPTGIEFKACPPCLIGVVERAEVELGFVIPETLKEIYTAVANGGFGPGYGVMGVCGGFTDDRGDTVEKLYAAYRRGIPDDPSWQWPEGWLPICHWGCVVYSVMDCLHPPYPVYFMDAGVKQAGAPMDSITHFHKGSFDGWLSDWMDGKDLWKEVWG
jgi:hypothetical protein